MRDGLSPDERRALCAGIVRAAEAPALSASPPAGAAGVARRRRPCPTSPAERAVALLEAAADDASARAHSRGGRTSLRGGRRDSPMTRRVGSTDAGERPCLSPRRCPGAGSRSVRRPARRRLASGSGRRRCWASTGSVIRPPSASRRTSCASSTRSTLSSEGRRRPGTAGRGPGGAQPVACPPPRRRPIRRRAPMAAEALELARSGGDRDDGGLVPARLPRRDLGARHRG